MKQKFIRWLFGADLQIDEAGQLELSPLEVIVRIVLVAALFYVVVNGLSQLPK